MNVIVSQNAPKAIGPYSQAMVSNGMLYISGTAGVDPQTGKLQEGIEAQTEQAVKNIAAILEAAGTDFSKVVKTTCCGQRYLRKSLHQQTGPQLRSRQRTAGSLPLRNRSHCGSVSISL